MTQHSDVLMLMLAIGFALSLLYYWLTRPEPVPTTLEEDITRRAIAKISWRKRPSGKTKSNLWNPNSPEQGMMVTIPFDHSRNIVLYFAEGVAVIPNINARIELAAPDSIDRLAGAIERAWAAQYK